MSTSEIVADLKGMPLLRSITIHKRRHCNDLLRQIGSSNRRLERLVIADCRGESYGNLASVYLTRILEHCVNLRSLRISRSGFTSVKFYQLLGMAVPRLREFHTSHIDRFQLLTFFRQLETRSMVNTWNPK